MGRGFADSASSTAFIDLVAFDIYDTPLVCYNLRLQVILESRHGMALERLSQQC